MSQSKSKDPDRLKRLLEFDQKFKEKFKNNQMTGGQVKLALSEIDNQTHHLVGVDEVGRGCLAGPVVACACVLPDIEADSNLYELLIDINDSKQIAEAKREELSDILSEHTLFAIAEASVEEIDQINILQASLLAMRRAVEKLNLGSNTLCLIDGNKTVNKLSGKQITVIKGDSQSASIACASILAKVYRDKLMAKLHPEYSYYDFAKNKGYGSKKHREALVEFGPSNVHRLSFLKKILPEKDQLIGAGKLTFTG